MNMKVPRNERDPVIWAGWQIFEAWILIKIREICETAHTPWLITKGYQLNCVPIFIVLSKLQECAFDLFMDVTQPIIEPKILNKLKMRVNCCREMMVITSRSNATQPTIFRS